MRANFFRRLLYSDTDNLPYKVESDDLYFNFEKQKQDVRNESNFSAYPHGHALHNVTNKYEVLKSEGEQSGDIISEFICLKQKMYRIISRG